MNDIKVKTYTSVISRIPLYVVGIFVIGFGIVLCVKCGLGISPINSIPYVLSYIWPLSLGIFSIIFYLVNIFIQLMLSHKSDYIGIILQLPVSLVFGLVIDMWNAILPCVTTIGMKILYLAGSVFFTAFGIMLLVAMHLVPDPPTGTVQCISRFTKKKLGNIKIIYDVSCVVISLFISFMGLHKMLGFGIATIVSALCVGKILAFLQGTIGKKLKKHFQDPV